jgi:hypothetical protein
MEKRSSVVICDNLLDHILYECMMYYGTLNIFFYLLQNPHVHESLSAGSGLESDNFWQVAYESHLLHARNLLKFFERPSRPIISEPRVDDDNLHYYGILKDFPEEFTLANIKPEYDRISTMLSHLSPKRIDTNKITPEEVKEIAKRIFPCAHAFWESVLKQDNFRYECKWHRNSKNIVEGVKVRDSFLAENCPNHEWMSDVSKFELKHAPSFSDITITGRPKESKLAKADESLNRKLSFLGIETDTTTCNAAYKVFSANLDDDKEE